MIRSYTLIKEHKVTFEWTIENIMTYFELYDASKITEDTLYSSNFHPNETKQELCLGLKFYQQSLDVYLCAKNKSSMKIKCKLYVLNNKKERCQEKTFVTTCDCYNPNDDRYISGGYLEITAELVKGLSNNILTVGCDLIIYEETYNTESIYKPLKGKLIGNQLKEVLESQSDSDITFVVSNQEFKAHTFMLMVRSPVFKAMFENDMLEKRTNQVIVTDIRPEIFKMMLEFIYTEIFYEDLNENDVVELFAAADKYQLEDLKKLCSKSFCELLEVKNAMKMLKLAEQHNNEEFINMVKNFIDKKLVDVFSTLDFEYFENNLHHAELFFKKSN